MPSEKLLRQDPKLFMVRNVPTLIYHDNRVLWDHIAVDLCQEIAPVCMANH